MFSKILRGTLPGRKPGISRVAHELAERGILRLVELFGEIVDLEFDLRRVELLQRRADTVVALSGWAFRLPRYERRARGPPFVNWSGRRDLNSRPSPWQGDALPLSYFRVPGR